jgi:hypothetical protein
MSRDQGASSGMDLSGATRGTPMPGAPMPGGPIPGAPTDSAPANRARTILAGARHALLTLPTGCRRPGGARERGWVGLVDDGGEPVLLARATSAPALATLTGSTPAHADIPGPAGERLVLAGTLVRLTGSVASVLAGIQAARPSSLAVVPDDDPDTLVALRLTVSEVLLSVLPSDGSDTGTGGAGSHRTGVWATIDAAARVGLDAYALADPDLIAAYAPDLIAHLNQAHSDVLRALAIRAAPAALDVAGAWASGLDREGLTMWQVLPTGAEPVRIRFRQPLTEPRALGAELRRLLRYAPANDREPGPGRPGRSGRPGRPGRHQRPDA